MLQDAHLPEICVFGYDCKSMLARVAPDVGVRRFLQPDPAYMHATGIEIGQTFYQLGRQVVVKEKFHFVITVR